MFSSVLELTTTRFMTKRRSKFACSKISALPRSRCCLLFSLHARVYLTFPLTKKEGYGRLCDRCNYMETAFFAIVCDCLRSAICDRLRSTAIIWKPAFKAGFHMIADRRSQIAMRSAIVCDHMETYFCDRLRSCDRDRRRSQAIAEDRTMFYLLRSSAIPCDQLRLCDHMETKVLRSAIETYPIILRVLSHDSTLVCSIVGTVYVATIISLSFRGIYGGSCSL